MFDRVILKDLYLLRYSSFVKAGWMSSNDGKFKILGETGVEETFSNLDLLW